MNVDIIFDDIRRLIFRLVRAGKSSSQIETALAGYLEQHGMSREFAKQIQDQAAADWVEHNTIAPALRQSTIITMGKIKSDFGKVDGHIKDSIIKTVTKGLKEKQPLKELTDALYNDLNRNHNWADAVAHTSKMTFSRTRTINQAIKAGVKEFDFMGPGPQRKFCKDKYRKRYTIKQIKRMDNGQGLPVLNFCGGYRCAHRWVAVIEADETIV